jgi:hypothetical protein
MLVYRYTGADQHKSATGGQTRSRSTTSGRAQCCGSNGGTARTQLDMMQIGRGLRPRRHVFGVAELLHGAQTSEQRGVRLGNASCAYPLSERRSHNAVALSTSARITRRNPIYDDQRRRRRREDSARPALHCNFNIASQIMLITVMLLFPSYVIVE